MTPDHYATLGVAPSSEDSAIRAAYLELMRRYHPDKNASAQAAEQARAITAAYEVLSDWHRRAEYDLQRARMRAREGTAGARPARPAPKPSALFAAGSVLVLVLVLIAIRPPLFTPEQPDRLRTAPARQAAATKSDPAVHCRSAAARDAIKHELFRRAARLRGSDRAAFDRLARHALVRIDLPELIDENVARGTVDCAAIVALDLPPGVAVLGGQRTLTAEVDYSVQAAATGGGPIRLVNEGLIVAPLATLVQIRPAVAEPAMPPMMAEGGEPALPRIGQAPPPRLSPAPPPPLQRLSRAPPPLPARAVPQPIAPQRAAPQRMASQPKPSFSCRIARGRGEIAVCKSANLAKLDRHLGMLYGQSWGQADAARREQLLGTRDGFVARRDACRSDSCISATYINRMREISEIMTAK